MSSPHVAGAAAVLEAGQPRRCSPAQVQDALTATASAVLDADENNPRQWQVGYGHVNLDRAVELVRRRDWEAEAHARPRSEADKRMLREDAWKVARAATCGSTTRPRSPLGGSDSASYTVDVSPRA